MIRAMSFFLTCHCVKIKTLSHNLTIVFALSLDTDNIAWKGVWAIARSRLVTPLQFEDDV